MRAWYRNLSEEQGQSLVIIVLAMFVVIAMGAMAIDVATWYQRHHQAQVAVDSAALAAANCMANAGQTSNPCTTASDTTDATNLATTYAADNGITIAASAISINTTSTTSTTGCPRMSACVTGTNSGPSFFGGLFGIRNASQTARAAATYTAPISNTCSNAPSGGCYFAFAKDSNCSDTGITLTNNGNATVAGGIWSDSGLNMAGTDNNGSWGAVTYGTGCTYTPSGAPKGPNFVSGPSPAPPITTWPRDYTTVITACGGIGNACNTSGTPSFCTQSAANFGTGTKSTYAFVSGQVYCAYGSGTKSDPSSWNGTIYVAPSTGTVTDTFIGGYVNIATQGSVGLNPQLTTTLGSLLVYANDASGAADVSTQGKASLMGDLFAPNGTINLTTQGSGTATTFLEGNQVAVTAGGGITGDGPQNGYTGHTLPGADLLSQ